MPTPHPSPSADGAQRLAKVVAAQLRCSRREAEQYVTEGWVTVDGRRVEVPETRVTALQRVAVDPQARLQPVAPVTLLLHKPAGAGDGEAQALLDAAHHWSGDASGIRRTRSHGVGLVMLLPLPTPASGLAVFSQDRRIVRKLQEDAALIEQELVADVAGTPLPGGLERLGRGLVRAGTALPPLRASWQSEGRLRLAMKGIPPEGVPSMLEQVGLELVALRRIRIGRIPMAGLPVGRWRYLPAGERF